MHRSYAESAKTTIFNSTQAQRNIAKTPAKFPHELKGGLQRTSRDKSQVLFTILIRTIKEKSQTCSGRLVFVRSSSKTGVVCNASREAQREQTPAINVRYGRICLYYRHHSTIFCSQFMAIRCGETLSLFKLSTLDILFLRVSRGASSRKEKQSAANCRPQMLGMTKQ